MIDYEKLKKHPLTIIIAKLEANIMTNREIQKDLMKVVAKDLNYPDELLLKALSISCAETDKQ